MAAELSALISRLETVTTRLETVASRGGGGPGGDATDDGPDAAFVQEFDATLKPAFANFMQLSSTIGGDVKTQAGLVETLFNKQRDILVVASKAKKPSDADLPKVLTPMAQTIGEIQEFKNKNRGSPLINHITAIAESVPAFGWVGMSPTPGPHVKEMADCGQFYSNRVLKEYKDKDKKHVEWVRSWFAFLTELQSYIKKSHTTGLSWNPKVDAFFLLGSYVWIIKPRISDGCRKKSLRS